MESCDIYQNVNNITRFCEVSVMGETIKTECIPLCLSALYYAVNKCSYIYKPSGLYEKIVFIIKNCNIMKST